MLAELKKKTPQSLWSADLGNLTAAWDEFEAQMDLFDEQGNSSTQ